MSEIRKRPRQERSKITYEAILVAATQLFGRLGYAGTTTNKVAERAGVSIGSYYQYFPDKDALLLALTERHLAEAMEMFERAFARLREDRPGLEGTVDLLLDVLVALHQSDPALHRILFDLTPRSRELVARLRALEARLGDAVGEELERLGVGGAHPRARGLLMVQGLEAQVHGAVLDPPDGLELEALVAEMKGLWLRSLRG